MAGKVLVSRICASYIVTASHEQVADEKYRFFVERKGIGNPPIILVFRSNETYSPQPRLHIQTPVNYGRNQEEALKRAHEEAVSFAKIRATDLGRLFEDISDLEQQAVNPDPCRCCPRSTAFRERVAQMGGAIVPL